MKTIASIILLAAATSAGAVTVETTDFITSPSAQNGFEGIGSSFAYPGASGYTEDGITVTYVGTPGNIWTTFQPVGNFAWYPNGGSDGYTRITFGGTVNAVEFLAGSGWAGGGASLYYDVLLGGVSVGSGTAGPVKGADQGYDFYGFSGATFDEVRIQSHFSGAFGETTYEALAIDNIQIGDVSGGVPEPATWALMILGFGLVGAAARRRTAVAA